MGYEIIFHYKKETEEKGVYEEEVQSRKIKVGTPTEDTPLSAAAAKIFAQLARRNILVTDVEIYEYTKKKLSYKETEDGFKIKNRKFRFDDGPVLEGMTESVQEEEDNPQAKLAALLAANPSLLAGLAASPELPPTPVGNTPKAANNVAVARLPELGVPLREEVFDPPPWLLKEAKKRGLAFTVGKKYPIYKESPAANFQAGMNYTTVNDRGQKEIITSIHFNVKPKLSEGFVQEAPAGEEPNLVWDGVIGDGDVPNLRG